MKKQSIVLGGLWQAVAATIYIGLVTIVMSHGNAWFGEKDTAFTPMAVLMLLVLSATVMGSLTFLRPILWYIDNKKHEALWLLAWTIIFFSILTVIVLASIAAIQ